MYREDDLILRGSSKEILVNNRWIKDKLKQTEALNRGFVLFVLWEDEWKYNLEIKEKLLLFCIEGKMDAPNSIENQEDQKINSKD